MKIIRNYATGPIEEKIVLGARMRWGYIEKTISPASTVVMFELEGPGILKHVTCHIDGASMASSRIAKMIYTIDGESFSGAVERFMGFTAWNLPQGIPSSYGVGWSATENVYCGHMCIDIFFRKKLSLSIKNEDTAYSSSVLMSWWYGIYENVVKLE